MKANTDQACSTGYMIKVTPEKSSHKSVTVLKVAKAVTAVITVAVVIVVIVLTAVSTESSNSNMYQRLTHSLLTASSQWSIKSAE